MNFPVDDDTGEVATVVGENMASVTTSPVLFDNLSFGRCPQWRSGHIVCSMELAADSAFNLANLLTDAFGRRFARGVGAAFVATLLGDSDTAVTSASSSAITLDEVLSLVGSLDAAFAVRGSFLMAFSSYIALLKQKGAGGGAYLVDARVDAQGYPTLFGRRVYLSPSMPAIATAAKVIAYGDLSKFIRRQVRNSLIVNTYVERYAASGQIGYEAFLRTDGKLAKAANSPLPVRLLACHV
jgi:HK97 family phage major capsid protein